MVLVFFIVIFILIVLILATILSTMYFKIENLNISNENHKFKFNAIIYIELYFLDKIKIFKLKINPEKINLKEKIDFDKLKNELPKKVETKKIIQKLKIELEKIDLNIEIGTQDVLITSGIVAILGSAIGIVLGRMIKKYDSDKYSYLIIPNYKNINLIKVSANCIVKVKMVHIISIIYFLLIKRRKNKNERTSNRRSYEYSYE